MLEFRQNLSRKILYKILKGEDVSTIVEEGDIPTREADQAMLIKSKVIVVVPKKNQTLYRIQCNPFILDQLWEEINTEIEAEKIIITVIPSRDETYDIQTQRRKNTYLTVKV